MIDLKRPISPVKIINIILFSVQCFEHNNEKKANANKIFTRKNERIKCTQMTQYLKKNVCQRK